MTCLTKWKGRLVTFCSSASIPSSERHYPAACCGFNRAYCYRTSGGICTESIWRRPTVAGIASGNGRLTSSSKCREAWTALATCQVVPANRPPHDRFHRYDQARLFGSGNAVASVANHCRHRRPYSIIVAHSQTMAHRDEQPTQISLAGDTL